jgi:hypothetical protein
MGRLRKSRKSLFLITSINRDSNEVPLEIMTRILLVRTELRCSVVGYLKAQYQFQILRK